MVETNLVSRYFNGVELPNIDKAYNTSVLIDALILLMFTRTGDRTLDFHLFSLLHR
jgi:hypothetical protein